MTSLTGTDARLVAHDGLELAISHFGPTSGPGLLLLHGFGQSRGAWLRTAQRLGEEGWHAVCLDLRGHGDSQWAERYHFEDFERDVELAADLAGPGPVLVGASMGGILSLLVHDRTNLARAIALVDVTPDFDLEAGQQVQGFMAEHRDGFTSLDDAAEAIGDYLPQRERRGATTGLLNNLRPRGGRFVWKWDPRFADGVSWLADAPDDDIEDVAAAMSARMTAAAERLTIPTLLVRGSLSRFVPPESAERFSELVPQARRVDVQRAGHMVAGDDNDTFTRALLDFLSDVRRGAGEG